MPSSKLSRKRFSNVGSFGWDLNDNVHLANGNVLVPPKGFEPW
jgi:hypothetical protein